MTCEAARHLHLVAFAPVLALAAYVRLYDLGHGHPGLAIYTSISSHAYKSFHNWFYPNMFADGSILADKPPLFFWYQGLFIALLGPSNVSFRLPVAIAGICSVVLLYVIVRRCSGTLPALIAAAALAIMPIDVNYSRGTFIEPVVTVTMLFAAYFVVRAVQEKREGFYYVGAFILGLAFMVKLWQGLMPAPAFALLALAYRWQPWPELVKIGLKCTAVFLVAAFWWPLIVWLTPGAYDSVMHADNVWHMIFGWNLFERYGELEYGARHRRDMLWFITGPMSVYFGTSLFPATLLGAFAVIGGVWHRAWEAGTRVWNSLSDQLLPLPESLPRTRYGGEGWGEGETSTRKFSVLAERLRLLVGPVWTRKLSRPVPPDALPGLGLGVLWLVWLGIGVIGFGGASIRLATYWTATTPAIAALAGIGIASIPSLVRRGSVAAWLVFLGALAGVFYCMYVFGFFREVAPYFRAASNISLLSAGIIAIAAVFVYFGPQARPGGWRPFRLDLPSAMLTAVCVGAIALTSTVTYHNLTKPRDDTLGRIGFDQIDIPGFIGPEPTLDEERKQRQGALITAIVRTEFDQVEAALEYVRERRGEARYLLASDTYNTGAMVALITGEPVLPLYSEYKLEALIEDAEFKRLLEEGHIPFILTTRHMLYMDFDLYTRMRTSSLEVTTRSGLPGGGELELLRVTEW